MTRHGMKGVNTSIRGLLGIALALFASVVRATTYYVGPSGDDSADGTTPETALASVSTAVGKCSTAGGDEVVILRNASPYQITATITLDRAVTVRGETGDPADAVLRAKSTNYRIFAIGAAATVTSLTVENADYTGSFHDMGAGIYVNSTGAIVSNCVVRGCIKRNFNDGGGGIAISKTATDALVTHCVVSNCQELGTTRWDYPAGGAALAMYAGTARDCLFVRNVRATATGVAGCCYGTVRVIGGRLENCTIANNSAGSCAGVWAQGGKIVNCIIADNKCTGESDVNLPVYAGDASLFENCVSDGPAALNENCTVVKSPFVDSANGDWRLAPGTMAVDGGTTLDWMAGTKDVYGNARIRGSAPDVGASEIDPDAFGAHLELSSDVGLAPFTVVGTVAVANAGASGVTCEWDWDGDGVYEESGDALTSTHVYASYCTSPVTVRVTDKSGGTSYETKAHTVKVYPSTHYVSKADGVVPTAPYATPETAANDVATALAAAAAGAEIVVAPDTYTITKAIDVLIDVTIRGSTGRPEDVVLHSNGADHRILTMAATKGCVHSLTIENASFSYVSLGDMGAGVYIYGLGGTISNCIVRNCTKTGFSYGGGGIGIAASTPALVTHCVVSNCTEQGRDHTSYPTSGSAIAMYGGTVRNCLLVKNYRASSPTTASFMYGTVHVKNGTLENCTIADNTAGRCAGVWAEGSAIVANCLIANNKTLVDDTTASPNLPVWAGSDSCFANCVSDGADPINSTCRTATDPFVNAAGGDWHLDPGASVAVDTGTKLSWMTDGATDFYGNPRVRGKGDNPMPDIGAHEVDPYAMSVRLTLASTIGFKPAKAVATVTVTGGGDSGFTCEWDWDGDGVYEETTETLTAEHVYDTYGTKSITARVTDKDSGTSAVSSSLAYSVYPKTMYVGLGVDITPVSPYDSPATAAPDINAAHAAAVEGCEIVVLPGVYSNSAVTTVEKAVTVRGLTGRAEDVVLRMQPVSNLGSARGLALGNAAAVVSGLTIENANLYSHSLQEMGAGVYIYNGGGTLSNCVVRNCRLTFYNQGGGGIGIASSATDALVTHCVISNCQELGTARSDYPEGGGGIVMFAGTVRNCLLTRNDRETATGVNDCRYGTVRIVGGLLENCTIAGNSSGDCAGVWAQGGKVRNCVVAGNTTSSSVEGYHAWTGTASCFTNSVADATINDTCRLTTATETFKYPAGGNFKLRRGSPAIDFAVPQDWMAGAKDLVGRPRVSIKGPDCGAYECALGFAIFFE